MKKTYLVMVLSLFLLLLTLATYAQPPAPEAKIPKWISQKGFWVVESNVRTPLQATVYFYTNNKVLVYKETLQGMRLNTSRRRTRIQLNRVLEQSIAAWEQDWKVRENEQLMARLLRR